MEIPSIDAIARVGGLAPLASTRGARASGAAGFADALGKALSAVNQEQHRAQSVAERFQLNDQEVSLEETMIAMQKANISFQSLVQVRNRLLSAYHEIMNLQI
ncbi:MAG: flagellar hook-basal body complex protein FliE [Betaproteobacteria bacterium]|nr:flagellar hook-basal body complex protein FliE [Betaproteobacteria bacterium]